MVRRSERPYLKAAVLPKAVVLDSGALSAAAQGDVRVRAELVLAEQLGVGVHVSSVVLAECLRGHPRDARVHAVLAGTEQEIVTPSLGRAAGEILGDVGSTDTIDAIVAVTAQGIGGRVRLLTGDARDLLALTADMAGVTVVPI